MVVLGILGYFLRLSHKQLDPSCINSFRKVVIVDDCSLSGKRFALTKRGLRNFDRVIFAHLISHPLLRKSILETESQVDACFAAGDLCERDGFTGSPAALQALVRGDSADRYWIGYTEPVAFSWAEPDMICWNPKTQTYEHGWHFAPPHLCLGARLDLNLPDIKSRARREFSMPKYICWKLHENELLLIDGKRWQVYGLMGVASEIWRGLVGYGNIDMTVDYILNCYDVDEKHLMQDLPTFVKQLINEGLLLKH